MVAVGEPDMLKADLATVAPVNIAQDGTILGTSSEKKSDAWMAALDLANGKVADAPALVTNTPAGLTEFAGWSPDGSKAAAIGFKAHNATDGRTLVIRPTTGGAETRIDLDASLSPSPSPRWASVGDQLLVGIGPGGSVMPGTVDLQTGRVTKVNIPAKFATVPGVLSPDGRCYFTASRQTELANILMYDTVSKTEKEILQDREAYVIRGLSPSPDGKRLAYNVTMAIMQNGKRVPGHERRLRVLDVDSGAKTEVAVVSTSWWGARFSTAWTPDGRSLIFAREDEEADKSRLFTVPSAGGEPKPISKFEQGRIFDLAVSPDVKMLGYTRFNEAANFWLIQNVLPKH
jgi:Tol biopolymer transport system component